LIEVRLMAKRHGTKCVVRLLLITTRISYTDRSSLHRTSLHSHRVRHIACPW